MAHQNFEKYAKDRSMQGRISSLYVNFFLKNVSLSSDCKILDFGCGDGRYFNLFKKYFKQENIYGIEISKIRIDRCRNMGWVNAIYIDKENPLPFPENYFDFINFDQVIEHIPKDKIEFYLKELRKVLKTDGKIIILTPNYPIKRFYDILNAITKKSFYRLMDDSTHVNKYNFKTLERDLNKYFTNIKLEATGGLLHSLFRRNFFSRKIIGVLKK